MSYTTIVCQAPTTCLGQILQLTHAFNLPAALTVDTLKRHWHCDQSTVSRRLQAFRTANLAIIRRTARATYWIDPLVIS
jgi:hypothetical protein